MESSERVGVRGFLGSTNLATGPQGGLTVVHPGGGIFWSFLVCSDHLENTLSPDLHFPEISLQISAEV